MSKKLLKTHKGLDRPPFDVIALLLQGGGSLGAYQGGVYQALAEAGIHPDWVSGTSIGAINAALIAGNPPENRVDKLREFWEYITRKSIPVDFGIPLPTQEAKGDATRGLLNRMSAGLTSLAGVPGFFKPQIPTPWLQPSGTPEATGYYDATDLKSTLERLVDFDRINSGKIRFSVCAVKVKSGNFVYFDTMTHLISPEHIMASGALPPGFSPIEIEGEFYWDGGLISHTPLQWVADSNPCRDTLIFQIDLWSSQGEIPRNMQEVMTRQKEILYSSRTRANTDRFRYTQKLRQSIASLLGQLPDDLKKSPETTFLKEAAACTIYNIVHLIYRPKNYEGHSKDYDFSRQSMEDHWKAGYYDTIRTLHHPEVLERHDENEPVLTFDFNRNGDG